MQCQLLTVLTRRIYNCAFVLPKQYWIAFAYIFLKVIRTAKTFVHKFLFIDQLYYKYITCLSNLSGKNVSFKRNNPRLSQMRGHSRANSSNVSHREKLYPTWLPNKKLRKKCTRIGARGYIIVIELTCQSHVKWFWGNHTAIVRTPVACFLDKCLVWEYLLIYLYNLCLRWFLQILGMFYRARFRL